MGYRSRGFGNLIERRPMPEAVQEELKDYFGLDLRQNPTINIDELKMYYTKKQFLKLAEYFDTDKNGIEIMGEDNLDVWKIHINDGKIFIQKIEVKWLGKTELADELGTGED